MRAGSLRRIVIDVSPLRETPAYRWLWLGALLDNAGSQVTLLALPFQVYVLSGSVLAVGGLAAVRLAALLCFALPGGSLADAYDRRRLLIVAQFFGAATSLILAGLAFADRPPLWAIYVVAFVATGLSTIDGPTRRAVVIELVGARQLPSAVVLEQAGSQAASIFGPAMGGVLIAALGLPVAYLADAATFAASLAAAVALPSMRPRGGGSRPGLSSVLEGLRFARQVPIILSTFVVDLDAMIFGMPVALFPILAVSTLHGGPTELGLLTAAPAVGALAGALTTGWLSGVRHQGRVVIGAVGLWGVGIAAFGLSAAWLAGGLVCLAVAGWADVISAVMRATIIQTVTPDRLRGRLSALHTLVVTGGPRLGDMEATAVAAVVGAPASAFLGGILCLVGLVGVHHWFPQLAAYAGVGALGPSDEPEPASA